MSGKSKNKVCVYLNNKSKRLIDTNIEQSGANNRSDFIDQAIECYCAVLNQQNTTKILTPALESVIRASISKTEDRLAQVVYKDSVTTAMMMHLMAEVYDIDPDRLKEIRSVCIREINTLNGRFKFEDAVNYVG